MKKLFQEQETKEDKNSLFVFGYNIFAKDPIIKKEENWWIIEPIGGHKDSLDNDYGGL